MLDYTNGQIPIDRTRQIVHVTRLSATDLLTVLPVVSGLLVVPGQAQCSVPWAREIVGWNTQSSTKVDTMAPALTHDEAQLKFGGAA